MKSFKTIDEQIKYLEEKKSINFSNLNEAKQVLLDNNYFNVISCGKVKFAENIQSNHHIYSPHDFKEWLEYFQKDCLISTLLMENMINFERNINSRTAYYVSDLIENDILKIAKRNEVIARIEKCEIENLPPYVGKETWKYITKMTFGEVKYLLNWLYDNQKSVFHKIIQGYDFLRTGNPKQNLSNIVNLRNCLFHFTPLAIYLGFARRKDGSYDNRYNKSAVRFIFGLNSKEVEGEILEELINDANRFQKIKNS